MLRGTSRARYGYAWVSLRPPTGRGDDGPDFDDTSVRPNHQASRQGARHTPEKSAAAAEKLLHALYEETASETFDSEAIHLRLNAANVDRIADEDYQPQDVAIKVKRGTVRGRGANQAKYLHAIATHDINFGIGPVSNTKGQRVATCRPWQMELVATNAVAAFVALP